MERNHGTADAVVLAATVCLALITWFDRVGIDHVGAAGVGLWKPYAGVMTIMLLALASLTRHRRWTATIRIALGVWILAAPFLLNLPEVAPARAVYLAAGAVILAVSVFGGIWAGARHAPSRAAPSSGPLGFAARSS
jgi:hypothetical protein